MNNQEIIKNARKIWREELKGVKKIGYYRSYNDKRSFGRRLKMVCSVVGMDYYNNIELRDNVIKKIREFIKDNNIENVYVDGWSGYLEVVVFLNRKDKVF